MFHNVMHVPGSTSASLDFSALSFICDADMFRVTQVWDVIFRCAYFSLMQIVPARGTFKLHFGAVPCLERGKLSSFLHVKVYILELEEKDEQFSFYIYSRTCNYLSILHMNEYIQNAKWWVQALLD